MSRKNKHDDSSNNFNLIGKKRFLESEINEKYENEQIKKNSEPNYDTISGLYKNIFGFDWTDSIFKQGQQIIDNITPEAIIFLYNSLYFKQDLYNINLVNKSFLLNSFFDPFDMKYPDPTIIKKSQIIPEKVNFIFKMIELFNFYKKNKNNISSYSSLKSTKEEEFKNFHSFIFQKYQHIKNFNRLRVGGLIEKLSSWQIFQKTKEESLHLPSKQEIYIKPSLLLKDNQIPNISQKILNNFCSCLRKTELEINKKKLENEKIFESNIEVNRTKNDENWNCFVCNNGHLDDNDIFYECEQCKISVHQNCYGILTNDSENWICDACKVMSKEEAQNLECVLCPVKGGAMKQINLPSDCEFLKNLKKIRNNEFNLEEHTYNSVCIIPKDNIFEVNRAWVHLSCALWSPDIYFANFAEKTNIKYVDTILYEKFMEECQVCGKRGYGPTIKCNKEDCNFRCHPECARINGYRLEIENLNNNLLNFNLYCYNHQPVKLSKILEKFYKNKEQKVEDFAHYLKRTYRNYEREYQKNITEFIHPNKLKTKS
jgi:hypothetical protein